MKSFLQGLFGIAVLLVSNGLNAQEVTTEQGKQADTVCSADLPAVIQLDSVLQTNQYNRFAYIIANKDDEVIQTIKQGDKYQVKDKPVSTHHIWGMVYDGNLAVQKGTLVQNVASSGGFQLSNDFLPIQKQPIDGGKIIASKAINGAIKTCYLSPSKLQLGVLQSRPADVNYRYLITDHDADTILAVTQGDQYDAQALGVGFFKITGIAYQGQLKNAAKDQPLDSLYATGCWEFSQNKLTIDQGQVDGGKVITSDFTGDTATTCPNENLGRVGFEKKNQEAGNVKYQFFVTGKADEVIQQSLLRDHVNFDQEKAGEWHIHGISYKGTLENFYAGSRMMDVKATGCLSFSDNHLVIQKDSLTPHSITVGDQKDSVTVYKGQDTTIRLKSTNSDKPFSRNRFLATSLNGDTVLNYAKGDSFQAQDIDRNAFYWQGVEAKSFDQLPEKGEVMDSLQGNCYKLSENRVKVRKTKRKIPGFVSENPSALNIQAYPNPVNNEITVSFETRKAFDGEVMLVNPNGKIDVHKDMQIRSGQSNSYTFQVTHLPSGTYLLKVRRQNQVIVAKSIVVE